MVFTRKQLREIFIAFLITISALLLLDKTWVVVHLFSNHNIQDLHSINPPVSKALLQDNRESLERFTQENIDLKTKASIDESVIVEKSTVTHNPSFQERHTSLITASNNQQESMSSDYPLNIRNIVDDYEKFAKDPKLLLSTIGNVNQTSKFYDTLNSARICPKSIVNLYSSQNLADTASSDMEWCKSSRDTYNVVIGRSWGGLPPSKRKEWDIKSCNDLLKLGKIQTCDERYGWSFNKDWLSNMKTVVSGVSTVKCITNLKTTIYCQSRNVVVDFSKAKSVGLSRQFNTGFLETYGYRAKGEGNLPDVPGLQHISEGKNMRCDITESRPAFVLSNDDIYNLGHYINDVMMVWNMVTLANKSPKQAILVNVDGIREGGPAGGPAHRLMEPSDPDRHGPYVGYFKSWFQELKRGVEYGGKRVCFKPTPGVPWFWNDWGIINQCSTSASSPLYQSFNLFLRYYWKQSYGEQSLPEPDRHRVHIVIEVRKINKNKSNNHSSARYIRNLQQLIQLLESTITGIRITAQDFASIPFERQVALSHSAGVFMSMHGAGTTHIFHAALGSPNCCALVELFPDPTIEFHTAHGYGNLARMLGFHHYRYVASMGRTTPAGTEVDINQIRDLVAKAVEAVKSNPTCLHNVKDTTQPIYENNAFDSYHGL